MFFKKGGINWKTYNFHAKRQIGLNIFVQFENCDARREMMGRCVVVGRAKLRWYDSSTTNQMIIEPWTLCLTPTIILCTNIIHCCSLL